MKGQGKTLIVYTADKNEKGDVFTASDGHELKIPIAILVNGDSASASEVFTGALKDYDWATVVGNHQLRKGNCTEPDTSGRRFRHQDYHSPLLHAQRF